MRHQENCALLLRHVSTFYTNQKHGRGIIVHVVLITVMACTMYQAYRIHRTRETAGRGVRELVWDYPRADTSATPLLVCACGCILSNWARSSDFKLDSCELLSASGKDKRIKHQIYRSTVEHMPHISYIARRAIVQLFRWKRANTTPLMWYT